MLSRTQLRLRVRYDSPIRDARRVLRVLPLARAGQIIVSESWEISPRAQLCAQNTDEWNNRRLILRHENIEREFQFELNLETQTAQVPVPLGADERLGQYKLSSRAVEFGGELQALGRAQRALPPFQRATYFCLFCHDELHYRARAESQPPNAATAWQRRVGSCADFAHIFLALCRTSGLAARYVAGYNPAQGQLHAWAEVLVDKNWHAFDPTHGRAPSAGCVVVGVGRDFYDLAPHVGSFRGEAGAELELWCRTEVRDGAISSRKSHEENTA